MAFPFLFRYKLKGVREVLEKLYRPIEFALRREGNLRQLKGLERFFLVGTEELEKFVEARELKGLIERLRELFRGFDQKGDQEKKRAVVEAKVILEEIGNRLGGQEKVDLWRIPLSEVKGVGRKTYELLKRKGLFTVGDALWNLPIRYEDRRELKKFFQLVPGEWATAVGKVLAINEVTYPKSRRKVLEVLIGDDTGFLTAKWFQGWDYLKKVLKVGTKVVFSGEIKGFGDQKEVLHPDLEVLDEEGDLSIHFGRIVPVYPSSEGLKQKRMRSIMYEVVSRFAHKVRSAVPFEVELRCGLLPLDKALQEVHFPSDPKQLENLRRGVSPYHQRLAFEELFLLELALALKRQEVKRAKGISMRIEGVEMLDEFIKGLPFTLTEAQRRVLEEIKQDLSKPYPMYRLLQGDVGSGKTVVALAASVICIANGYQVAMMAPTEILAEQHFQTAKEFLSPLGVKVAILTSRIRGVERNVLLGDIALGEVGVIVGTHALIQEEVRFKKLGLVIVDEQHRFGVLQRAKLYQKGEMPHLLVMTATPIPRTLAMTLYGDMEVSIIDQMPPHKASIETLLFWEEEAEKAYEILAKEVRKGRQAYVIYPLIEESEQLDLKNAKEGARNLSKRYPEFKVALIHGRMRQEEKNRIMESFRRGEIQVLVSTTIVEVGIDVPNATVILVEEAQRFGLAQLHQLRGRVGRGAYSSYCLLVARGNLTEEAKRRLKVMEETNDGFRIAEEDLAIRGPGDIMGIRQWGQMKFKVAELPRDLRLLLLARREAFRLIKEDPTLDSPHYRQLKELVMRKWGEKLDLATIG